MPQLFNMIIKGAVYFSITVAVLYHILSHCLVGLCGAYHKCTAVLVLEARLLLCLLLSVCHDQMPNCNTSSCIR